MSFSWIDVGSGRIARMDPEAVRAAIRQALPVGTVAAEWDEPNLRRLYLPPSHRRALDPRNMVVKGIRGAGKTFWWAALQRAELRARVQRDTPGLARYELVAAWKGREQAPSQREAAEILDSVGARHFWFAAFLWAVADPGDLPAGAESWLDRCRWVAADVGRSERVFREVARRRRERGRPVLVLVDAVDRLAGDWGQQLELHRELLRLLLDVRRHSAIGAKLFLRADILDMAEVRRFPDASKVFADAVDLAWSAADLYGLFWQHIGNARLEDGASDHPGAVAFRETCERAHGIPWQEVDGVWVVPPRLRRDERLQQAVLHGITGPWMGRNARRGRVYTWLVNHLADGRRQVSPRSFLTALRRAADEAEFETVDTPAFALGWSAIRKGVQAASRVRVDEIAEDHPWVELAIRPLAEARLSVPVALDAVLEVWERAALIDRFATDRGASGTGPATPPGLARGLEGIVDDLIGLGVFHLTRDGRLQMPDVYRVAFGLGRKGGVPPIRGIS